MTTKAELSKMLFQARESIDMWADVVEKQTGRADLHDHQLTFAIDTFRSEQGWSPYGFGGEGDEPVAIS